MVIQNNQLNLNTNLQSISAGKPETKYKPASATQTAEQPKEESIAVSLTDASKRRLDRAAQNGDHRISPEEGAREVESAQASILKNPAQAVSAQSNQDAAAVASLLE